MIPYERLVSLLEHISVFRGSCRLFNLIVLIFQAFSPYGQVLDVRSSCFPGCTYASH